MDGGRKPVVAEGDGAVYGFKSAAKGDYTVTSESHRRRRPDCDSHRRSDLLRRRNVAQAYRRNRAVLGQGLRIHLPEGSSSTKAVFKDITSAEAAASKAQELLRQNAEEKKNYYVSLGP